MLGIQIPGGSSRRVVMLSAGTVRQKRKEFERGNPSVKGSFLGFHLVNSLWLRENVVHKP